MTEKQEHAYNVIRSMIHQGKNPTIEEVSVELGKSWATTRYYIKKLTEIGAIHSAVSLPRSIRLLEE